MEDSICSYQISSTVYFFNQYCLLLFRFSMFASITHKVVRKTCSHFPHINVRELLFAYTFIAM